MEKQRWYFCIDMKCFFASCECAERGLDPFTTPLVVADEARGQGAICLAISPYLKSRGVKNRCRLYEVPKNIPCIIAKPRMKLYIRYAADIYGLYLRYIAPEDIHVYSIDEAFIDATDYLKCYHTDPEHFARFLLSLIAREMKIPATAGIGTNLYLAKIALDITAKKARDHIGLLTEERYRETLWHHTPLSDFWQIAGGTERRLKKHQIFDMAGIARAREETLYREFGVNAELLIDHAWGRESCLMRDIKKYRSKRQSLSTSQVLFFDYDFETTKIVLFEMVRKLCQDMMREHVIADHITMAIGYSREGPISLTARVKMTVRTQVYSLILPYVERLFEKSVSSNRQIRRLALTFSGLCEECRESYDLFTDIEAVEKEKKLERTVLDLIDKYGKNSILRLSDFQEGATARERNRLIGGHNGE